MKSGTVSLENVSVSEIRLLRKLFITLYYEKRKRMIVYKFKVTLDIENDVWREIEIRSDQSFFTFHKIIIDAFDFKGDQMSAFYMSNAEWDKGEEIILFDMGMDETGDVPRLMENTQLREMIGKKDEKILYVYDFLRLWVFYIELTGEIPPEKNVKYPRIVNSFGEAPDEESKSLDFEMPVEKIDDPDEELDPELKDLLDDLNDEAGTEFLDIDDIPEL